MLSANGELDQRSNGLDEWGRRANILPESALEARRLATELRRTLPDCEFGLNIGSEVGIYFYGRFRPAAGVLYQSHVDESLLGDQLLQRIRDSPKYHPSLLTVDTETIARNERLKAVVPQLTTAQNLQHDERLSNRLFDVFIRPAISGRSFPANLEP